MMNWYPVYEAFELAMTPTHVPHDHFREESLSDDDRAAFQRALSRPTPFGGVEMRLLSETLSHRH